jgi:hypothetical protein
MPVLPTLRQGMAVAVVCIRSQAVADIADMALRKTKVQAY